MNVRNKLDESKIEKRAFIGGRYVSAKSGKTIIKKSSIDGKNIDGIVACDKDDVDYAVEIAQNAYITGVWRKTSHMHKRNVLLKLASLMEENCEMLALLDTYETGRAYKNYYYDSIPKAIEALRFFAECIDKYYDKAIPSDKTEFGVVVREPLGVVGIITPWNDPMVVSTWKLAPALAMGNSVVLKPAEQSSLSAIFLAGLTKRAGIPDGVFNVVPGYGEEAGKALALHKDVRGIFFTGSSEVGKLMLTYSGQSNMKKVGLECGGKGPYIITNKCRNLKRAAKVLAENMFYNQGQICSAPSRVIVDENLYDDFIELLKTEAEKFVPGEPFDDDNDVGCLVSKEQYEKVINYINLGKELGATVYQAKCQKKHHEFACCVQPTIISGLNPYDKLAREEIFGPVVVVLKSKSSGESVAIANDSEYGLAGAIWTDDINEAYNMSQDIQVGLLHINSYGNDDNRAPFGGVKKSGLGKDKSLYAFDEYSEIKSVWMHFEEEY